MRTHWLGARSYVKNVNFYQLEGTVSTSERTFDKSFAAASLLRDKSNSGTREFHVSGDLSCLRLVSFNQVADALRIRLAMSVAGDGISPASGFDDDFRPEDAS